MNKSFKIIIVSIALCLLLTGIFIALNQLFHVFLYDLIVKLSHKWLNAQLAVTDSVLFWGYPILTGILFIIYDRNIHIKKLIQVNAQILIALLLCLFVGIIVALLMWPSPSNDFLPSYIIIQPFYFYWTPFILAGIALPIYLWFRKRNKKHFNQNIIDNEIK